ncbi:MAG: asparagine synthase (glutamine-hydrolyzing) [Synechococcus sp. TMED155]|jgi:asparagine synthase (glutamine-hydrolysing)|nr:MAG: asparagine synthase (glutamine-hydrolyzing) [Synechococcus sp. TMED155]
MCGIGGVFNPSDDGQIDPQLLVNMAAIQAHRGPDGFGYAVHPRGVGMAHARLSIIDLEGNRAQQPFRSACNRVLMAHNGEFYDFQRIRAELVAQGVRFSSKSDSEILLHLYLRNGLEETLPHLRGEFAFALYDAAEDCLHLVRDRFGIKPLYWTLTSAGLIFGSELKVLFAHPAVKRGFSPEGLFHQLMQTMVPGSTAFAGIHQVQPGHVVTVKRRNGLLYTSDSTYWDVNFPKEEERNSDLSEQEHISAVREALLEAIELRLVADVPVGCYLSGGIDSCSILGLAAAVSQKPIKAFTIGFDDSRYDETEIATEMAIATEAEQDTIRLSAEDLYEHFESTLWHTERTVYNTLAVAKYLMSRHVRNVDYKVVLTGEGSDELFAGYPSFRRDMFLHAQDGISSDEQKERQHRLNESNALVTGAMLAAEPVDDPHLSAVIGFTPSCLQPWLACAPLIPELLAKEHCESLRGYEPGKAIAAALDRKQLDDRHALDRAQYVWIKTMLEGQILTWGGDRVDMANSMEARPPFLDHHLAATAVQVPPELRIHGHREKHVLREAVAGLLPERLYNREKFAFMAPPAHADDKKLEQLQVLIDTYLNQEALERSGLLSPLGVQQLLQRHADPRTPAAEMVQLDAMVNHLLGVQILHKLFVEADLPAQARQAADSRGWHVLERTTVCSSK